ncbi:MAG: CocE/NonD family hydrolase [Planctomycetota bacterium]
MKNKTVWNVATRFAVVLWCALCGATFGADPAYEVEARADMNVPMRDGVQLSANVFLPKTEGRFPVLLARTPYGKGDAKGGAGRSYASRGYVYISQDCRGRGASGGEWVPFVNERCDGQDTLQWILAQPWSNGKVGTVGGSYLGFTQWMLAPGAGESLKAMFTAVPLVDVYDDLAYVGGAYQLQLTMGWGSAMAGSRATRAWKREDWLRALPLCTWDTAIQQKVQYLRDWVAHPQFDDYWRPSSIRGCAKDITAPIYVVGGWYDIYAKSVFDHLNAVRKESRSNEARAHQHLLMGPWPHGVNKNHKVGDLDFGEGSLVNLNAIQSEWLDHWLKGKTANVETWPPFRIFVMGRNQWRDEKEWPLQRTRYTPYYFHSQGSARTLTGDGQLSTTKPDREPFDRFVYDPDDPVPTAGGCNLGGPAGPRDQTSVEQREDVLVFTSDELTSGLEVTGPVKVILYAASSATDTDWTAKLVDVWPDGRPINLCDGILRARYRESADRPTLIEPEKIYCYEIDLWVTSNVFLRGHRIRVEVSSSNFPRFDRNPNTGQPFGADTQKKKAAQTVYHDGEHASHILLPVIP